MSTTQLIELYCIVCEQYNTTLCVEAQRLSNNFRPQFTDEETITVYLWGTINGFYEQKAIYAFIHDYYLEWFPKLPSYQNFSRRLNYLAPCFIALAETLLDYGGTLFEEFMSEQVIDSLPILVAKQARSSSAKTASELCAKGYCATKKQYYYGVKLHLRGCLRPGTIPAPCQVEVTGANEFDLSVAKRILQNQYGFRLYADKAYCDREWAKIMMKYNRVSIVVPPKKNKGQKCLSLFDDAFSTVVSSIRQPIESLFNWLIVKTHIQNAGKSRSVKGLFLHIFGKLAAAFCLLFLFNS
jgi:primosomal replication protein N